MSEFLEPVVVERSGATAILRLNRPAAMNAVNAELAGALGRALEEFDADPTLRVAVLTGNGRAFCAGADLKAIAAGESVDAPGHADWGFAGFVNHRLAKPIIAAVNGFALGGGTEIVLASDLAVMSEDAALGLPEVSRGLFAAAGGAINLPAQVPLKAAKEMVLTGQPVASARALELGLVNEVCPREDVLDVALGLAERIASNAPLAVAASKRLLDGAVGADASWTREVWALNSTLMDSVFTSKDAVEGATAFAQKREPQWQGR